MDEKRELMRHIVATVAYRAARALDGAPEGFADFDGAGRRPEQILAHMGDLFDWALSMAEGDQRWAPVPPRGWAEEKHRFFAALAAFDAYLASDQPMNAPLERLLQGPVTDALTHVGQLAMMRRLAGSPACGENFYVAAVAVGQVGAEQPAAVRPFKEKWRDLADEGNIGRSAFSVLGKLRLETVGEKTLLGAYADLGSGEEEQD
jgi:hypothetical protein